MNRHFIFSMLIVSISAWFSPDVLNRLASFNRARSQQKDIFPPPTVMPIVSNTISFTMYNFTDNSTSLDFIKSKVQEVAITEFNQTETINEISNYILFALDLNQSSILQMRWNFKITQRLGLMTKCYILATIINRNVTLIGNSATAEQQIPTFYTTENVCSHSGSRKYVFGGPRSIECSNVQVPRGLTPEEIETVKNRLVQKLDDTKI